MLEQQVERLAVEATLAVGILVNIVTQDFELWPIGEAVPGDLQRRFNVRGLYFSGVFGLRAGQIGCALEYPLPPAMQVAISAEFERVYWREIVQAFDEARMGDTASWCERLFRL